MASGTSIERIQAPFGGINNTASEDYVGATQAVSLMNLVPGQSGKACPRGPITRFVEGMTIDGFPPKAFWSFDDFALVKGDGGVFVGVKTWRVDVAAATKTDVTATMVESPLDSRHVRYGANVYGAIVDAASPQLGKWDGGATAIVPQANAPFRFVDIQPYAQRLFVLGGTLPGTTTPVVNSGRVLFFSDPDPAADLSLLASWRDDTVTVPVINQIQYDGDDTPVGLAGCGKYMAIVGSRSINILTGSGSSSYSVRNLTKNWGCSEIESIVEVNDGFYFQSDRGFSFCDGSTVTLVSETIGLIGNTSNPTFTATMFSRGYVCLCSGSDNGTWLYHIASRSWTQISVAVASTFAPTAVYRTNSYPVLWQDGLRIADRVTDLDVIGMDVTSAGSVRVQHMWSSRFARLAGPGQIATIRRLLFEYKYDYTGSTSDGWRIQLLDTSGQVLVDTIAPGVPFDVFANRNRFQLDCGGAEADSVQLVVTSTSAVFGGAIFDAYVEFDTARNRPSN